MLPSAKKDSVPHYKPNYPGLFLCITQLNATFEEACMGAQYILTLFCSLDMAMLMENILVREREQ